MKGRTFKELLDHLTKKEFEPTPNNVETGEEYEEWRTHKFKNLMNENKDKKNKD